MSWFWCYWLFLWTFTVNKVYNFGNIQFILQIISRSCTIHYSAGGRCSHMVGLVKTIQQFKILGLEAAPAEQSCTSIPQTWHIPRGNKISPVAASQIVVVKAKETRKKAPIQQKMLKSVRLAYTPIFQL